MKIQDATKTPRHESRMCGNKEKKNEHINLSMSLCLCVFEPWWQKGLFGGDSRLKIEQGKLPLWQEKIESEKWMEWGCSASCPLFMADC